MILLAILALLGLSTLSASRLIAWVYASHAVSAAELDAQQLPRARAALDVALRFWPLQAEYHNQRGLLAVRSGDFETGEQAYLQSLKLRPTWPYTWANLAQYWLIRGQSGELFTSLWKQGMTLGPAEDRLHLAFSQIGLDNWYRLTPPQRAILRESLDYLLIAPNAATSLTDLKGYARSQRLQPLLCRLSGSSENLTEWCEQYNPAQRADNS